MIKPDPPVVKKNITHSLYKTITSVKCITSTN